MSTLHDSAAAPPALRVATRGSALALAQADLTEAALAAVFPALVCERLVVQTSGDRFQDRPLAEIGGKALFTKEIDEALLAGRADIAVHSLKDVPSDLPEGLMLAACLSRAEVRDVMLCGHAQLARLSDLPPQALVGTSSPRRALQMMQVRPDLRIAPIRGNVSTRIAKVQSGQFEASLLAAAGMQRLAMPVEALLSPLEMLPAVGQGIVVLACRTEDRAIRAQLEAINHAPSWSMLLAERALLAGLHGTCRSPIAGLAELDGAEMTLHGYVSAADGSLFARQFLRGAARDAVELGQRLARRLLAEVPHASFA